MACGLSQTGMKLFDQQLLESIGKKLISKKSTIAVAESVTSGLLQLALSSIPDAACFFQGGITAYNLGQKFKHLNVEPIHASSVNCVSQQVALEMATHVSEHFNSDWGIGITGYATPVPESDHKLFSYFAITYKSNLKANGKLTQTKGKPFDLQRYYTDEVLKRLAGFL